jgi:Ca2+-binding EF-hand superfamily protein
MLEYSTTRQHGEKMPLTADQQTEVKEVFALFETNKSGTIPANQIGAALRALGAEVTDAEG